MFNFFNSNKDFTCFICESKESSGRKNTAHGEICSNCAQRLSDFGISHREAKFYSREQVVSVCDTALTAVQRAEKFILSNSPIALKEDEHCYYIGTACGGKIKTVTTGYTGANKGYSLRVMKNVTYHSGGSAGRAVREQVLETSTPGTFVITGSRFVLLTTQYGFEIPAHKVGNIELNPEGLTLYAGNKCYIVVTPETNKIATVVRLLGAATEEQEQIKKMMETTSKTRTRKKTPSDADAVSSAADEIRKYKQLADEGIITEEEFEAKKKQLLSL